MHDILASHLNTFLHSSQNITKVRTSVRVRVDSSIILRHQASASLYRGLLKEINFFQKAFPPIWTARKISGTVHEFAIPSMAVAYLIISRKSLPVRQSLMSYEAERSENNPGLLSLAELGTQPEALLHWLLPSARIRVLQHQSSSR